MTKSGLIGIPSISRTSAAKGMWDQGEIYRQAQNRTWIYRFDSPANYFKAVGTPTNIQAWGGGVTGTNCTITADATVTDSPCRFTSAGSIPMRMAVTGNDPFTNTFNSSTRNVAAIGGSETWEVRVFAKASVNTTIQILIFGAEGDGTWVTGEEGVTGTFSVTTNWGEYAQRITYSNLNSQFVQLRLDGPQTGGSGQTIWFDGLQVYKIGP